MTLKKKVKEKLTTTYPNVNRFAIRVRVSERKVTVIQDQDWRVRLPHKPWGRHRL